MTGAGGGWRAIGYVVRQAIASGAPIALWRRLRRRNACKTCALGMGGQRGGMVDETGRFPEVCKKSVQAQVADMAPPLDEAFFARHPFPRLEAFSPARFERAGRLAFPLIAGPDDDRYRRAGWDEALERAADALRRAPPERTFVYASGRSSNEAAFLLQLVARARGIADIHNCSSYCHAGSGAALKAVYGSGTASIVLEDLDRTDLVLLAGANPASNHPRLMSRLVDLVRRGGQVIVVNPLREAGLASFRVPSDWRSLLFGSRVATLWLMPHAGGDAALFKGLLKTVLERGAIDSEFIAAATTGWEAVRADVEATSWTSIEQASGVPRAEIERAADAIARAERGIAAWAMGLTHHEHGVDAIRALANLVLARGWLGRPGAGLLPIRGHSNVQGVGSVGVTPALAQAFAEALARRFDIAVPRRNGRDTYASMEAAAAGDVDAAILLGGNLFASNPDRRWAAAALRRIGTTISISTKLNEGHVHGRGRTSIVLPALARDEELQSTTQESMFNYVRVSEGGTPAVAGEMRSEVAIIADLARRILPAGRFDWEALTSHRALREAIAATVPGYAAAADVERGGEFQIEGRTFHRPRFATPDGRARFGVTPLPPPPGGADGDALRLITLRSEGQFNTVVYEEVDLYRGRAPRDAILISEDDARRLGVRAGQRVVVHSAAGRMAARVHIAPIRPGNVAMYYPEANVLVPRRIDRNSGTPAFKSVPVTIRVPGRRPARPVAPAVAADPECTAPGEAPAGAGRL